MLYTVQIRLGEDGLVGRMSEMREWLESHHYEPDLFRYRMERRGAMLRVDFKIERKLSRSPRRSAAAFSGEAACLLCSGTGLFKLRRRNLKLLCPNPKLLFRNIGARTQDHFPRLPREAKQNPGP